MELDCGIAYERIASWLDEELALARVHGRWSFAFGDGVCRVSAEPLPKRSFGAMALDRTLVTIDGDPAAVDELYRLFTLRFASAGG